MVGMRGVVQPFSSLFDDKAPGQPTAGVPHRCVVAGRGRGRTAGRSGRCGVSHGERQDRQDPNTGAAGAYAGQSDRVGSLFEPISLLLTSVGYLAHLRQMLPEAAPRSIVKSAKTGAIDRMLVDGSNSPGVLRSQSGGAGHQPVPMVKNVRRYGRCQRVNAGANHFLKIGEP